MSHFFYTASGSTLQINNKEGFENTNSKYEYKGCWNDKNDRAIQTFLKNVSPENCEKEALQNGFNTYGLQNGNQCFVGNNSDYTKYEPADKATYESKYGKVDNDTYKNLPDMCGKYGNLWMNQVYQIPTLPPLPPDMKANNLTVFDKLCFKTDGKETTCLSGSLLNSMNDNIKTINDTIKEKINVRLDKSEASIIKNMKLNNESIQNMKTDNDNQIKTLSSSFNEQYKTISTLVNTNTVSFKTQLDELNKQVYDMKQSVKTDTTSNMTSSTQQGST